MECRNHQSAEKSKSRFSIKKAFVLSLVINLCFLIGTGAVAYYKRDTIVSKFEKFKFSNPSEDVLSKFNSKPLAIYQDSISIDAERTISIMFLGNSLTRHGITELWDHECGMAATIEDNDYVHQLVKLVSEKKNVNVKFSACNIADFERHFATSDFDWNTILSQSEIIDPDYVIIQIGENMNKNDVVTYDKLLRSKYMVLLNYFSNSTRIITLPFWLAPEKNSVFTDIAISSNSYIVDLSHLGSDSKNNYASSERYYEHYGVGNHPGDKGMKSIAVMLFSVINNTL